MTGETRFYSGIDLRGKQAINVGDAVEDTDGVNLGQLKEQTAPIKAPGTTTVYVTQDWATDPNNPQNGGSLPAGIPVFEMT